MRLLIDEMFSPDLGRELCAAGHDAVHVHDVDLTGAEDSAVLARAVQDDRTLVTENVADFVALLEARTAAGLRTVPVVFALKRTLPHGSGAMNNALVKRLTEWGEKHPDPYRHVHCLG